MHFSSFVQLMKCVDHLIIILCFHQTKSTNFVSISCIMHILETRCFIVILEKKHFCFIVILEKKNTSISNFKTLISRNITHNTFTVHSP